MRQHTHQHFLLPMVNFTATATCPSPSLALLPSRKCCVVARLQRTSLECLGAFWPQTSRLQGIGVPSLRLYLAEAAYVESAQLRAALGDG